MAMAGTDIPYIISFTIQQNGRLVDGNTLDFAMKSIDQCVEPKPLFYMTNCVHPAIVYEALSHAFNQTEQVGARFIGIQANTSPLPYAELDGSKDLKCATPEAFAQDMLKLKQKFGFKVFGGCCGTDSRHIRALAQQL